jgi:large subunit ribosomal protein L11e
MDFFVVLERPGNRVSRRKHASSHVGPRQRVTKQDSMKWFETQFDGVIHGK